MNTIIAPMKTANTIHGTQRKNLAKLEGARNCGKWFPVQKHLLKRMINSLRIGLMREKI
jgi:hypothetical protein